MRGKPFEPGNKMGRGRPPGKKNRKTLLQESMESHGEAIIKKVQLLALSGDPTAMRLCVERLVPVCKPPASRFRLPSVMTVPDLLKALPTLAQAVAQGELTAQEGEAISKILETHRRTIVDEGYGKRLGDLEQKKDRQRTDEEED